MEKIVFSILLFSASMCHGKNLCARDELVYFSCSAGDKIISICTSDPIDESHGYLQYRYGSTNRIELIYPPKKVHPLKLFTNHSSTFSGGAISHVNFTNGSYTYAVYDSLTKSFHRDGRHTHIKESGVKVVKNGKVLSSIMCTSPVTSDPRATKKVIFTDGGPYEYWRFFTL